MTPERLAELRDLANRSVSTGEGGGWGTPIVLELLEEISACREANRAIHEQDAANVAKLCAIRALADTPNGPWADGSRVVFADDVLAILDGDA